MMLALCRSAAKISIHAPHAGSDRGISIRTATRIMISIHAPHAGSDGFIHCNRYAFFVISIHAPHAGSDRITLLIDTFSFISIHAPHAGSDACDPAVTGRRQNYFNPRPPCGERQQKLHICKQICIPICAKLPKI